MAIDVEPLEGGERFPVESFSAREIEILRLVAEGLSNKEIAQKLYLSLDTVKGYLRQVNQKLYVNNRTRAVIQAKKLGILNLDTEPVSHLSNQPFPRNNLPAQITSFVGRADDIANVKHLLNQCHLLTLTGLGGAGKTRLALQIAEQLLPNFKDGVYFVSLVAIDSPRLIPMAVAEALNFSLQPQEEPKNQLINYLRESQTLLVMDNFEHVLDGRLFISELLQYAPRLKIIATSRERLNLREEWILPIGGMSYPDQQGGNNDDYDALQLFSQCARRIRPDFSVEDNIDAAATICHAVEGLPLALELAATWVHVISLEQIAEQLEQSMRFLNTSLRNIDERHRSMIAVFNHSWKLLSEPEQYALMMLSVFRGGFELQAAEQVAHATLPVLAGLVDKFMIRLQKSGRYDIHELVRQYAAEMLEAAGQTGAARQAHCNYFASFLEHREVQLVGWEQLKAMNEIAADWDNVRVACDWIIACRDFDALDQTIESLYVYGLGFRILDIQEFWRQAIARFTPQAGENASLAWGRLLSRSVYVLGLKGSGEELRDAAQLLNAEKSLEIARHYGRTDEVAFSLWTKGLSYSDHAEVIKCFEESATLFHKLGDRHQEANVIRWLAIYHGLNGEEDIGIELFQNALTMYRQQGNFYEIGWVLLSLGNTYMSKGKMKDAEAVLHEGKSIHLMFRSPSAWVVVGIYLAYIALWRGDLLLAEERSPSIDRGTFFNHYHGLNIRGVIKALQGEYLEAIAIFSEMSTLFKEEEAVAQHYAIHWGSLLAYSGIGNYSSARRCLGLMYRNYKRWLTPVTCILAVPLHAVILVHEGQYELAAKLLGLSNRYAPDITGWMDIWLPTKQLPESLRVQLGSEGFEAALAAGREMTLDEVVALALGTPEA